MSERLIIFGAGNLGVYLRHLAETILGHHVIGFVDNFKTATDDPSVLGPPGEIGSLLARHRGSGVAFAIGYHNMAARSNNFELLEQAGVRLVSLIHPSAIVDPTCVIGSGCHILAGCVLDRHVELNENVFLNVGVCVAHDTRIGKHSFLAPRVAIAGFCEIGPRNVLGINSTVIDNIAIAEGNVIGAASTIIKSIETTQGVWVGSL